MLVLPILVVLMQAPGVASGSGEGETSRAVRVLGALGADLLAIVAGAGTLYLAYAFVAGSDDDVAMLGSVAALGSVCTSVLFMQPLAAWLGHRGRGSYWAAFAGNAIGLTAAAGFGFLLAGTLRDGRFDGADDIALLSAAALSMLAGPIIGLELSHAENVRVGLAPIASGAMGSLSLSF